MLSWWFGILGVPLTIPFIRGSLKSKPTYTTNLLLADQLSVNWFMEFFDGLGEWLDKLQHEDVTNLPISPPLLYTAKEGCLQNTAWVRDFVGEWIQFGHDFAFWIGIPCNQSDLFFTSSNITGDIPRWFDDKSFKPHGYMRLQRASLYMRSSSRSLSGGIERISKSKSWMSLGRKQLQGLIDWSLPWN